MGSKGGNVFSRGGAIGKYLRAKQSLDSSTNSLQRCARVGENLGSGRDEIFQPELFESSENMKKIRLDIRMMRPTLPDSANPGF